MKTIKILHEVILFIIAISGLIKVIWPGGLLH
jgi:hypothetical protein